MLALVPLCPAPAFVATSFTRASSTWVIWGRRSAIAAVTFLQWKLQKRWVFYS